MHPSISCYNSLTLCVADHSGSKPAEETHETEPDLAAGSGYSESKWVTEHLFSLATEKTGLQTTSVRVGQVSGDQRLGGWNTTEWVAALVRASQRLGCIPVKEEVRYRPGISLCYVY